MTTREEFIRRATRVTSFNLSLSDFTSDKHKDTIRHLYQTYFFASLLDAKYIQSFDSSGVAVKQYNFLVDRLKRDNRQQFEKLHFSTVPGIGPSELAMYILTDGILSGGAQSKDLTLGNKHYEIKAAKLYHKKSGTRSQMFDFKLGSTIAGMDGVIHALQSEMYSRKLISTKHPTSITTTQLRQFKEADERTYNRISEEYGILAAAYLNSGKNGVIFIQNEKNQKDFGHILALKHGFKSEDIMMERYTAGVIKPIVNIK